MRYLFIDTCSNCLIISTIINDKIDYFFIDKNNNDTSSKVMKVLKDAVDDINTVDKIFVVNGPGSFTGLRIGITVANSIAYANGVAIVGCMSDDWLGHGVEQLNGGVDNQIVLPEYGAAPHITPARK